MKTWWRAVTAVLMLAGFYGLALVVVGSLSAVATIVVVEHPSISTLSLAAALASAMLAVVMGLARAVDLPPFEPYGMRLDEKDQPQLWALVRTLAERAATRPPDQIWLVPEVNAGVIEDASMLGLRGGTRYLLVGLPLLLTLDVDQLRAVLTHELGHYSHAHTRLGEINYRARITLVRVVDELQGRNVVQVVVRWLFMLYARLYFLLERSVSRRQEFEADRAAAAVAGRAPTQAALRQVPALVAAWSFYLETYVGAALDHGIAPRGVFAAFPRFVHARQADLARLRDAQAEVRTSRFDTHPSTSERVAALQDVPDAGGRPDQRPAWHLLADVERLLVEFETMTLDFGDRQLLDWPTYTARGFAIAAQRRADAMVRALSRVTGRPTESLDTIFAAAEAGRLPELYARMARANAPEDGVTAALAVAAMRSGVVRVEHRWDGGPVLRFPNGEIFEPDAIMHAVESGHRAAARVRAWLRQVGIDTWLATPHPPGAADATTANVVGAIASVSVGPPDRMRPMDLIITDEGFVFTPSPKGGDNGKERLAALVREQPVAHLAAMPGTVWIPFEEIASARLDRSVPVKAALTLHDGSTVGIHESWTGEALGRSNDVLLHVVRDIAARD
jgi:Zn-dependent protease with chaperone function